MVFNWFRRQFGTSEGASETTDSETPQVEQEQAEEPVSSQSTQEQPAAVNEDYLTWAKTAYKNIQKRQEPQEAESTVAEPQEEPATAETVEAVPEQEPSPKEPAVTQTVIEAAQRAEPETVQPTEQPEQTPESEPEAAPVVASVEAAPVVASVVAEEEVAAAPEAKEELQTAVSISEEPSIEESEVVPSAAVEAVEAEEAPDTSVPIWARKGSADRQARLERLKATAIETPEPEPVRTPVAPAATTTAEEVQEIPGLAFDEGFLWSAEVLAAQGRRPEEVSIEEISWLKQLRQGLGKTRRGLINQLKAIVGQGPLNQDAVMEIEALLLQADVGVEATDYIIDTLQKKLREEVLPPEQAIAYLKTVLRDLLDQPFKESYSPTFVPEKDTLNIWLLTGVNGVGKTTTIGKLAHLGQQSDYRCLIAAADTFRAAAVEQVKVWGKRSNTEVIANPAKNADPAAVVFDAIAAAQARNTELLLVDTAGRLQNKKNLMEELAKIRGIIDKKAPDAKIESLLVLDATLGQNGLRQAEVFSQAAKLSGVVLTKLDGTAKGGVALAVVQQLGLPIRFIGAGEGIEDLRPFSSYEFVEALISG